MKKTYSILLPLLLVLAFITSCVNPIYDVSYNLNSMSEETINSPLLKVVKEFEYTSSEDKTSDVQHDGIKTSHVFNKDNNILYYENSSYGLLVYDEEKGKLTHACKDPICNHKTTECPYFKFVFNVSVRNGYAYFRQLYNIFTEDGQIIQKINRFVRVNVNTNELEIIKDLGNELSFQTVDSELYTDSHYYYFDIKKKEDDDSKIIITLMRRDLKTNKIENVKELGNQSYFLITYLDGKIYWYDPVLKKFMYSDKDDLSDSVEIFSFGGAMAPVYSNGDIIYHVYGSNDVYTYNLERGENHLLVKPSSYNYIITDKYIYYTDEVNYIQLDPEPRYGEVMNLSDYAIWRVNRITGEKEKIFRLSDVAPRNVITNFYISGNYIYAIYQFPNKENYDVIRSDHFDVRHILRINITTKELYLIDLPKPLYNGK